MSPVRLLIPLTPVEVVFNSPTDGETDVTASAPVRVQFSRGLNESSIAGNIRVSYVGVEGALDFKSAYDAANRAILITFAKPLQPFRTVKVEAARRAQGIRWRTVQALDGDLLSGWIAVNFRDYPNSQSPEPSTDFGSWNLAVGNRH